MRTNQDRMVEIIDISIAAYNEICDLMTRKGQLFDNPVDKVLMHMIVYGIITEKLSMINDLGTPMPPAVKAVINSVREATRETTLKEMAGGRI